jgi:hypothetical protein
MELHFCASLQTYTFVCKIHNWTEYVFVKPRVNFVNWDGNSINRLYENFLNYSKFGNDKVTVSIWDSNPWPNIRTILTLPNLRILLPKPTLNMLGFSSSGVYKE